MKLLSVMRVTINKATIIISFVISINKTMSYYQPARSICRKLNGAISPRKGKPRWTHNANNLHITLVMSCSGCQPLPRECSTRTCADDKYNWQIQLKTCLRPWLQGCIQTTIISIAFNLLLSYLTSREHPMCGAWFSGHQVARYCLH